MEQDVIGTVINRLRNTVSTVASSVSQLTEVLPGNQLTREYEATDLVGTCGPGLIWKIFSGIKKSTKEQASVFLFEKKQLENLSRDARETVLASVRRGVTQLTKLRHPQILTVHHPMSESRDSIAFATEPVLSSLYNLLNERSTGHSNNAKSSANELDELELKYGLIQLCKGLNFLHNDAKILHGNISPECVIMNSKGMWKIACFEYFIPSDLDDQGKPKYRNPDIHWDGQDYFKPNLNYLAPEYASTTISISSASDMFSLGMLSVACFNKGAPLEYVLPSYSGFQKHCEKLKKDQSSNLLCLPTKLRNPIKQLLSWNYSERLRPNDFSATSYFQDESIKTLSYLDTLFQWDNLERSKFYKGLSDMLPNLSKRIQLYRVMPCLAQDFLNPSMIPFILPNVFLIVGNATKEEYVNQILVHLRPILKLREPVQILIIFMKNMELLLSKTPHDVIKSDVLPLIYDALESNSKQAQEMCLAIIPTIIDLLDFSAKKNALLPRIKQQCLKTNHLSVRVNCLVCLGKILDKLDKWLVTDTVLPFLKHIPSKDPAVIMGIVGICKIAVFNTNLGVRTEAIANSILPFVLPLSVEMGLSPQQFKTIMAFVNELTQMVEKQHLAKLKELSRANAVTKELSDNDMNIGESSDTLSSFFDTLSVKNAEAPACSVKNSSSIDFATLSNSSAQNAHSVTSTPTLNQMKPSMSTPISMNSSPNVPSLTFLPKSGMMSPPYANPTNPLGPILNPTKSYNSSSKQNQMAHQILSKSDIENFLK